MASFAPSITFAFGSDARVAFSESLLASPPVGGITFGSFTDLAFVTLGEPTPAEAAAFSPPQRRGRAVMRPFGRPAARRTARAPARPVHVLAQPVRAVARRPVPRPHPVSVVRPAIRRPVPNAPAAQVAPAPQRRQPAAVVPPVRGGRDGHGRLRPHRGLALCLVAQLAPAPQRRQPVVVTPVVPLSHPETIGQTPSLPVVPVPPATQAVGSDVLSTSTSGLGRRARRNRNRRLRLAAS
ncbi:uncharacterized protein LOC114578438 [Dendrobium catenatum]|uniref:uncharacterized protein LOC114578438 n=1 Tax=Dendrobium catenatum TaxID=906689 RepID=UPI0010A0209F|nr:uncharacterized protein LOC114578438 [Dendrobium catenatum]